MTIKMNCAELSVNDCNFTATGETPGEIVEQMVDHLESDHGMDLPDVDSILTGMTLADTLMEGRFDADAIMVVRRLREKLDIEPGLAPAQ